MCYTSSVGVCVCRLTQSSQVPHVLSLSFQDMEKHGHLVQCFNELRQMLQTPIKPYTPSQTHRTRDGMLPRSSKKLASFGSGGGGGVGSGDEDERAQSPQPHSSSDNGSDLEDLLDKEFPPEDLPSLITRAIGKGEAGGWKIWEGEGGGWVCNIRRKLSDSEKFTKGQSAPINC